MLQALAAEGRPAVDLRIGPRTVCIVFDDADARGVLVDAAETATRPRTMSRVLAASSGGDSLFTLSGSAWQRRRAHLQRHFARRAVLQSFTGLSALIDHEISRWEGTHPLGPNARRLALRVALAYLFGAAAGSAEVATALEGPFERANANAARQIFRLAPHPRWAPTPAMTRNRRDIASLVSQVAGLLGDADAGSGLARALKEPGGPYHDRAAAVEALGMLFAGHETTASAMTWTLGEIGRDPEAWERCASSPEEARRAVNEAMRLHPPVWGLLRQAEGPVTVAGNAYRRGTMFLVPTFALHRDPRRWDDPESFRMDRWDTDCPPRAFLPFGRGPRHCIGANLATVELAGVVHAVTSTYRCEGVRPERPGYQVRMALRAMPEPTLSLIRRAGSA